MLDFVLFSVCCFVFLGVELFVVLEMCVVVYVVVLLVVFGESCCGLKTLAA